MYGNFEIEELGPYIEHLDVLSDDEKDVLLKNSMKRVLKRNDLISCSTEGEKKVLVLLSGRMKISMMGENSKAITLWWIFEGETCVIGAIDGVTFSTARICSVADTDSTVVEIKGSVYRDIFNAHKETVRLFERQIGERMTDLLWLVEKLTFSNTETRFIDYLVEKNNQQTTGIINLTQEEIALDLGVGRVIVSRMMRLLEDKNIIRTSRGSIKILSPDRLFELSS